MCNIGDYLGIWAILGAPLEEDLGTTWGKLWDYLGNTLAIPLHFWHYKDTTWALFWNNLGISWAIFDKFGHIVTTSWLLAERGPGQHIAIFESFLHSINISTFYVFILPIFRWYPVLQTSLLLSWCYLVNCWCCRQNPEKVRSWYHENWTKLRSEYFSVWIFLDLNCIAGGKFEAIESNLERGLESSQAERELC